MTEPCTCTFTVFTPTLNRANTLPRVYKSLNAQTFRDFEWLIVDDGSTDGTQLLVQKWREEANFVIRYMRQERCGKHIATNRAVDSARGKLFLTLDSDDECVPQALDRFLYHWGSIPPNDREAFSAVTGLCLDQEGRLVGKKFPRDVIDSNSSEIRYRYKVYGEKWGFQRTDVLREFPFSEEVRGVYVPEGIVWSAISQCYKTRYVNEALRIYWIDQPSMTHGRAPGFNAIGGVMQHLATLNTELRYFRYAPVSFLKSAVHYVRFSLHTGRSFIEQRKKLDKKFARFLWWLALPIGVTCYHRDRRK